MGRAEGIKEKGKTGEKMKRTRNRERKGSLDTIG